MLILSKVSRDVKIVMSFIFRILCCHIFGITVTMHVYITTATSRRIYIQE